MKLAPKNFPEHEEFQIFDRKSRLIEVETRKFCNMKKKINRITEQSLIVWFYIGTVLGPPKRPIKATLIAIRRWGSAGGYLKDGQRKRRDF